MGKNADLADGRIPRDPHDAADADADRTELAHQPATVRVRTDDADERRLAAERAHVRRHVGSAAEMRALSGHLHDRHRRLGRDSADAPIDELIEHQIPDDEQARAREAPHDRLEAAPLVVAPRHGDLFRLARRRFEHGRGAELIHAATATADL